MPLFYIPRSLLNAGFRGNYRKAFLACRKHRIDLTVLVKHNPKAFFDRVASFVNQVDEVDYINLFLTVIGCVPRSYIPRSILCLPSRGSLSKETIAKVCDAVGAELVNMDLTKYVNSILTAYVVKTPPDHESGLALLLRLRGKMSVFSMNILSNRTNNR